MRLAFFLLSAIACGGSPRPRDVRASARDGAVEVWWDPASFIAFHRVQLVDLDTGAPASDAVLVRGSHALVQGTASGVWVEAIPGGRTTGLVSAGTGGGSGAAWQVFAPWDFRDGALGATFAQLAPAERLAVLLVNFDGPDASAEVTVEGTAATAAGAAPSQRASLAAAATPALHEIVRARESALALERAAPPEALQSAAHRSFCVVPGLDFARHLRKPATLAISTAHADIYLDDDDLGEYEGTVLAQVVVVEIDVGDLGEYEGTVLEPLAKAFEE